jgi:hypothetical protein
MTEYARVKPATMTEAGTSSVLRRRLLQAQGHEPQLAVGSCDQ